MNELNNNLLTPEILIKDNFFYLIRCNGEEMGFCDSENSTILAIDSLAHFEQKRLEKAGKEMIYRQDTDGGKCVILSKQQYGYLFSGEISPVLTFDCVMVKQYSIIKSRYVYDYTPLSEVEYLNNVNFISSDELPDSPLDTS